jgi:uncharacterized membrane protein YccC
VYSINVALACFISYWVSTKVLSPVVARDDDLLGGMWAAVATAFVFRDTRLHSLSAGAARFIATCISFVLCLCYLWFARPSAVGIAILLAAGNLVMIMLNRREDAITTAITTIVVMVVAILSPAHAWTQPLLRLFDTVVGIVVGVACKWAASFLFYRLARQPVQ